MGCNVVKVKHTFRARLSDTIHPGYDTLSRSAVVSVNQDDVIKAYTSQYSFSDKYLLSSLKGFLYSPISGQQVSHVAALTINYVDN